MLALLADTVYKELVARHSTQPIGAVMTLVLPAITFFVASVSVGMVIGLVASLKKN